MTDEQLAQWKQYKKDRDSMLAFIRDIATADSSCTCHTESWHGQGHSPSCVQESAGALYLSIKRKKAA